MIITEQTTTTTTTTRRYLTMTDTTADEKCCPFCKYPLKWAIKDFPNEPEICPDCKQMKTLCCRTCKCDVCSIPGCKERVCIGDVGKQHRCCKQHDVRYLTEQYFGYDRTIFCTICTKDRDCDCALDEECTCTHICRCTDEELYNAYVKDL